LDVANATKVQETIQNIADINGHIDVLVANAGQSYGCAAEKADINKAKQVFDANFFGQVYCINSVIPIMRQTGKGCIVCIGSIASTLTPAFLAYYVASKAAIEGYAKAVRTEVAPFGINISVVVPGIIKTGITKNRIKDYDKNDDTYGKRVDNTISTLETKEQDAVDADIVAKTIYKIALSKKPKASYAVGFAVKSAILAHSILPETVDNLTTKYLSNPNL